MISTIYIVVNIVSNQFINQCKTWALRSSVLSLSIDVRVHWYQMVRVRSTWTLISGPLSSLVWVFHQCWYYYARRGDVIQNWNKILWHHLHRNIGPGWKRTFDLSIIFYMNGSSYLHKPMSKDMIHELEVWKWATVPGWHIWNSKHHCKVSVTKMINFRM